VVMALCTLVTLDMGLPGGLIEGSSSVENARTSAFTVLVFAQLFNCFNSRSERGSAFQGLFSNPLLWAAIVLSLILQVLVVSVPALNAAFDTEPLSLTQWLKCLGIASLVLWADELKKALARLRHRNEKPGSAALGVGQ
jgi:Ca2+-transporting ATPase